MALLLAILVLVIWGVLKNSNIGFDWLWQIISIILFWWVGSLFAPFSEVLSFHVTISTILAGICYCVAIMIAWMRIRCWFS